MKELIGEPVERKTHFVKTGRQLIVNLRERGRTRHMMFGRSPSIQAAFHD